MLVISMDLNICFLMGYPFFRMCKALMPGDEESMSDEAIWETLPVSFNGSVNGTLLKVSQFNLLLLNI
jgi:hypothetical protein